MRMINILHGIFFFEILDCHKKTRSLMINNEKKITR